VESRILYGLFNHWYLKGDDMVALLKCSVWLTNTRIYNHCLCHLQFCSLLPFPLYIQCIYSVHFNVWVSVCCISPTTLNVFLKNSVARHDTEYQQSLKVADCATVPTQHKPLKGFWQESSHNIHKKRRPLLHCLRVRAMSVFSLSWKHMFVGMTPGECEWLMLFFIS